MPRIPNLIFSTRAANPSGGVDFNREIVAESANVPREARHLFGRCADITLTARGPREQIEIFFFRSFRPGGWIFCRAKSLGLYRKTSHHLLIHGLVLNQEHLDALEGNPFLLIQDSASCFQDHHPGGRRELAEIELPESISARARSENEKRLEALSEKLGSAEESSTFHRLFEGVRLAKPISLGVPNPSSEWVEWVVLHLHPHDRVEVSFHTWATDGVGRDYDLSLVPGKGEVKGNQTASAAESPIAHKVEQLRRRVGAREYGSILRRYLLTFRSTREAKPLKDSPALLTLRSELGEPLEDHEQEIVTRVRMRGLRHLPEAADYLGSLWESRGFGSFCEILDELVGLYPTIESTKLGELETALGGSDLRRIWSALELVRLKRSDEIEDLRVLELWNRLIAPERVEELLSLFDDPEAAKEVWDVLSFYVLASAEGALASPEGSDIPLENLPYWPEWEAWAVRRGFSAAANLKSMEDLVEQHTNSPIVAARRYRELHDLALLRGVLVFAYRLGFQRELPTLATVGAEEQRRRLDHLVRGLVGGEPESLGEKLDPRLKGLRFFLASPQPELLQSGEAGSAALLEKVLYAVVFCTQAGAETSVAEALERLQLQDPSRLTNLPRELAEDWSELLFDELLDEPEAGAEPWSDAHRLVFEHCLSLTWWLWDQGQINRGPGSGAWELRLARLFEIGGRSSRATSEVLERVMEQAVSLERRPIAIALTQRFQTRYYRSAA